MQNHTRTSDILPNYLEKKENMASKQYENFMNILRKVKNPGWTSEQIHFIVGSKTINESVMDTNLDKMGINQKNKQRIKTTIVKTNIHSLLNVLKDYYENTHQDKPKLTDTEGTGRMQLAIDTRQVLDKHPPYHQSLPGPHICPPPPTKRHTEQTSSDKTYPSLIPQVDYTEGPTPDNPSKPSRTLLQIPTHKYIPPPTPPVKHPTSDHTKHPPHTTTRTVCSPKKARMEDPKTLNPTEHTHRPHNSLTHNEPSHTRKLPPEGRPVNASKRE
jgi:hypothetical protein